MHEGISCCILSFPVMTARESWQWGRPVRTAIPHARGTHPLRRLTMMRSPPSSQVAQRPSQKIGQGKGYRVMVRVGVRVRVLHKLRTETR